MNWKFWGKKTEEQPSPVAPTRTAGVFSTDALYLDSLPEEMADLKSPDLSKLKPPVGMDSSEINTANNSKNAFAISRQNIPNNLVNWYGLQGFIGYQVCGIIAQHWLVDKACTMPARDAARKGYEITSNDGEEIDPDVIDFIRARDKYYRTSKNLVEAMRMANVFGIRIVIFKVDSDDEDYYTKPFNIDGVKPGSYEGMSQVDPYWVTPEATWQDFSDPSAIDFYEPEYWRVHGIRYHRSHLHIVIPHPVVDVLKPTYIYGGVALTQKIYERVYAAEVTANEAPILTKTKRLNTLKIDLEAAIANETEFTDRLEVWTRIRDNHGIKVIGLEEEVGQIDTSLSDLDAVIMSQYQIVAAIAKVPATKLFGTAPKGFNSTGEFEESSYHEELESIQQDTFDPILMKHYMLVMKSDVEPKFGKSFEVIPDWHELDSMTAKERAEVNEIQSRADLNHINGGVLSGDDTRSRLIEDPGSGYNGLEKMEDLDDDMDGLFIERPDSTPIQAASKQSGQTVRKPKNRAAELKDG